MKLIQVLAYRLNISRRKAAQLIDQGTVQLNGETAHTYNQIIAATDHLQVHGQTIVVPSEGREHRYFRYYKPAGLVVSAGSLQAVYRQIAVPNLRAAGRLDAASEGLLILSNDGDFLQRLMHPSHKVSKKYLVWLSGYRGNPQQLAELKTELKVVKQQVQGKHLLLEIDLAEGQNRQIRRTCAKFGLAVEKLIRVAIGPIGLATLKVGEWNPLTNAEVQSILGTSRP